MTYRDDDLGRALRANGELRKQLEELEERHEQLDKAWHRAQRDLKRAADEVTQLRSERSRWIDLDYVGRAVAGLTGAVLVAVVWFGVSTMKAPDIDRGFVVGRHHHDAYTTTQCSIVGKVTVCTPVRHSERWSVILATEVGEEEHSIPSSRWNDTRLGEWFCVDPHERCRAPEEEP